MEHTIWDNVGKHAFDLERISVPGGWLVRTSINEDNGIALCFYPDPAHTWQI